MAEKPTYEELEKKIQELNSTTVELKRVKGTIKEKEEFNDSLLNNSPHPIIVINPDTSVRYVNPALEELTGYSSKEILGTTTPYMWWTESTQKKTHQDFDKALQTGAKKLEELFIKKNGEQFWVEITSMPTIVNGKINYYLANWVDITERKRLEKNFQQRETLLNTTEQLTKVGGWEWDVEKKTMFWTDEVYRIHDFQQSEFPPGSTEHIEQGIECYDPKDRPVIKEAFRNCVEKGQPYDLEFPFNTVKGRRIWIRTIAKPIKKDGTIVKVIGNIIDISALKHANETLRESEERFRQIYENMTVGVARVSLEFQIINANNAYCTMIGYREEELIDKHLSDITHPEILEENLRKQSQLVRGKIDHYQLEKRFIHKKGDVIHGILNASLVRNSEGKPLYFLGSVVDITERKNIEKEFQASEEKYRVLAEECPISIMTFNHKGMVTFVNKWHLKTFTKLKYGPEFFIGKKITELPGLVSAKVIPDLEKVLQGKSVALEDVHFPEFTGGHSGYQSIKAVPIYKKGEVVGGILIREDVSKRKHAEDALRESEEKYRSMMESMKDASYICSPELYIEYMNPAMIDRVGTDATGELCYKAIYDRDEKCSWCVLDQIQKGESLDYEVADPKDNRYYSVSNSPIFHAYGASSKLTIFHDISKIKDIEAQLRQSRKMESIGTLTGGIAHDFNNLLYMISGNTELALEDTPDWNPVHQNLQEIKTASLKAAGIVKQLLHFSRKTDQKFKPIGAVTVIKDSLKFLRSTIPSTIEIKTQLPDTEIPILADPIQINQIMMNLCINASHAMEKTGGTMEINIETASLNKESVNNYPDLAIADNYLKVTLSDTGPGIPSEIINRIFDPYFTTKEFGKGSGMGLTIVHGIVKNHNGAITVDSQVGKGTAFTILFPVIEETSEIITKKTIAIPHGTETILFVDDEKAITNMMQQILAKLGYHVETNLNPIEALDLFQSKPDSFDLVITDMTMPQMTGAKFAEKLKEIRSDIPIILCTGHSSLIDEDKANQSGIAGYVMKPVSMSKIAKAIREALDR